MSLTPGTRVGAYEITAAIGAGGMGEVYRARDTRLGRDVAVKVLAENFVNDPERVARFQREAQLLAALNHPHIASIYGLEETNGSQLLVMELVEGETLADRLRAGAVPVDEALRLARQVADALQAAHDKGIIHRDLKPANIAITTDGEVKVLDFGLAKALGPADAGPHQSPAVTHSPTLTFAATQAGVILGTAAYMAPEQAKGKPADKRSDMWAFGCVLYETLTGRRPFDGEDASDTMALVLTKDPDWTALPAGVPTAVRTMLRNCLERDRRTRMAEAAAALFVLDHAEFLIERQEIRVVTAAAPAPRSTRSLLAIAVASTLILAIGAMTWRRAPDDVVSPPMWSGAQLGGPAVAFSPRVSPDGRLIAFLAMIDGLTQVAVMQPDTGDWTVLTRDRTRGYVSDVSWSADSSRIFYGRLDGSPKGVFTVSALGGEARLVLEDAKSQDVLPDGSLVIVRINEQRQEQFYRFWPDTGRLQPFPGIAAFSDFARLRIIPGLSKALFIGKAADQPLSDPDNHFYSLDLDSSQVRRIPGSVRGRAFAVTPDGQAIIAAVPAGDANMLLRMPLDGGATQALMPLVNPPYTLDVTRDGSIYADQPSRPLQLIRLDSPQGRVQTIAILGNGFAAAAPLPDGRVVVQARSAGRNRLLVVRNEQEAVPFVQTSDETSAPVALVGRDEVAFIVGSASSRQLALASIGDGRIVRRLANIEAATVTRLAGSPDGRTLYYVASGKVWSVPVVGGESRFIRDGDSVAPDPHGRYLIVQLNEKEEVRLVRVPLDGQPEQSLSFPGVRLAAGPITPNAVRADGVLIKALAVSSSWFWTAGLLHPDSGKVDPVTVPSGLDVHYPGFSPDGRIVISTFEIRSAIWRFKPAP